ncbi:hypothetical protein QBC46DRAFT_348551, partial [Diplogelasinospora grovesii]
MANANPTSQSTALTQKNPAKIEAVVKDNGDARSFFDSIAMGTPCVFLCIGERQPGKCRIFQVQLKEDDDEAATLKKMREAWAKSRSYNWLPFRRVTRLEELHALLLSKPFIDLVWTQLRFSGVEKHKGSNVVIGTYETSDTEQPLRGLEETLKSIKESIAVWMTQAENGIMQYCPGTAFESTCDFEELDNVQYRMRRIYSSRDMLQKLYCYNPRIGEISQ